MRDDNAEEAKVEGMNVQTTKCNDGENQKGNVTFGSKKHGQNCVTDESAANVTYRGCCQGTMFGTDSILL